MTTATEDATNATAATPYDREFRRLALLAIRGDKAAEAELAKLERKIDDAHRRERRQQAAEMEALRVAQELEERRVEAQCRAKEKQHAQLVAQRTAAFTKIETATVVLAEAVKAALSVDSEVWALALQLGWAPETRTASQITNYIATQLGSIGAGLSDMPTPMHSALRGSLTGNKE
jgi:isochorismate synthase EntC